MFKIEWRQRRHVYPAIGDPSTGFGGGAAPAPPAPVKSGRQQGSTRLRLVRTNRRRGRR